jgi:hypothetical protein
MADEEKVEQTPAPGSQEWQEEKARLERELADRDFKLKRTTELYNQERLQRAQLTQQQQQAAQTYTEDNDSGQPPVSRDEWNQYRLNTAIRNAKRSLKPDEFSAVHGMIMDPLEQQQLMSYDPHGQVDFDAMFDRAHEKYELSRYREQQAKADEQAAALAAQQKETNKQAVISGGGAAETKEEIDVSKFKSSDEFIDQGVLEMDPNDPVQRLNPKPVSK